MVSKPLHKYMYTDRVSVLTMRGNLFFDNETVHLGAGNEYRELVVGKYQLILCVVAVVGFQLQWLCKQLLLICLCGL